ncbi:MAG: biotin/lipoyl-containing protein, partial [Candidatus Limnocylindrales bacterium]
AGPRHVEVQVLFDAHCTGVHLGERDCSLQRRHQKILEESPSPAVDPALRSQLGEAALKLSAAVGYRSAGTCEFLLDDDGQFHFLEMNTRLQVEHPVSEMITGRDLVADQLRIAAGAELGFSQADADRARRAGGHAIEVRLYAEDPDAEFLPSTGRIEALHWPATRTAQGAAGAVRIDSGIELGALVDTQFDPMLAKLIVGGRTRAEALAHLGMALDETHVLGVVTNLHFLRWIARQPVVASGEARIDTVQAIWPPRGADGEVGWPAGGAWQAAATALIAGTASGWRLNGPARIRVECDGVERMVAIEAQAAGGLPLAVVDSEGRVFVDDDGRSVEFRLAPPPDVDRAARAAAGHATGGSTEVASPMPGAVLGVHVVAGAPVQAGQPLVTLEAMKMEHVVTAAIDGVVGDLRVARGDQVARGQVLLSLTAGPGHATVAANVEELP